MAAGPGALELRLFGAETGGIEALRLSLSHPTQADRDLEFVLRRVSAGSFRVSLSAPLEGRWYLALTPAPSDTWVTSDWRISEQVDFGTRGAVPLGAAR